MSVTSAVIDENGLIHFIYDPDINEFIQDIADCNIKRASNVEPINCEWFSDIHGIGKLGPFKDRNEAIRAEIDALNQAIENGTLPVGG